MKAIRLMNVISKLNMDTNEELIDEIICKAIDNGVDINRIEEEESEEISQMMAMYC